MKRIVFFIGIVTVVFLAGLDPVELRGEFYRYVDENGNVHYVDDLGQVPSDLQHSVKTYEEKYDHLDAEERERRVREDRRLLDEREAEKKTREAENRPADSSESPVVIAGNQVLVPARVSYKGREADITFLLDTGATYTTLHKDAVKSLRIYSGVPTKTQVVGGKTIPSQMVQFDFIQVGPLRVENVYANVLEHRGRAVQHSGLLGMNFLRFADYSIDFDRQVIVWRPKTGTGPPESGRGR